MAEWIIHLIERFSYLGIALLMALENVFPPIPSELIMPFAGFVAARGDLNGVGVILAGSAGSLAGTLPWYWIGRRIGRERLARWVGRHGRWFTMSPEDLERAEAWLQRHGGLAVMMGRLVPALRSVISMPAGVTRMPLLGFLLWSSAGTLIWTSALASLGWALQSQYEQVADYLENVTRVVLVLLVAGYLWRLIRFERR
jgi:membrane protein DedA with SNARE-associated domain